MSDVESMDPVPNRAARRAAERRSRRLGAAASAGALASGTAAAVVGLFGGTAGAVQTYVVDAGGDAGNGACEGVVAGDCTLRDAVEDANNDGEDSVINFAASVTGTIVLTSNEIKFTEDNDITINGPGAGVLTIDGDASSNIFYADVSFQNSTASISGLTLTNGYSSFKGGAINFYADDGNSNLVLTNMVITGNEAEYYGGGVSFYGAGDLTINNSRITNNHTNLYNGGGILFATSNEMTITNSEISLNDAGVEGEGNGGGIYMYSDDNGATNGTIANSTIANNTASYNGGGIALYSNDLTLLQATISGNTAAQLGDGLYLASQTIPAALTEKRSKPERDRSEKGKEPKPAETADGIGALEAGTVTINATIISANPGTNIDTGGDGVTVDSTESLIGAIGSAITLNDVSGTIRSDTPGLGALADNGGFTQTMALQAGSAAIDQGLTTVPSFTGSEFDQRGTGFPRIVNGVSDIGAYELQGLIVAFTG